MQNAAYANIPIPLSLQSTTGMRYRTLSCVECGRSFLDREGDQLYRVGVKDMPEEAHAGVDGVIPTICGNCRQAYAVTFSLAVQVSRSAMPLNMQPQSIYLYSEPIKHFRDTHCMECGKVYFSFSDRIKLIVDSVNPTEQYDVGQAGAMEARCNWRGCKQRWVVRV